MTANLRHSRSLASLARSRCRRERQSQRWGVSSGLCLVMYLSLSLVHHAHAQSMRFNDAPAAQDNFGDANYNGGGNDTSGVAQQNLNEALDSYKRGNFLRASLLLFDIIKDKRMAANVVDEQAEYTLGKTLYRLNLYQASYKFFEQVVDAGPNHRYFRTTCKWLYYLSRKLPGDDELLAKIATYEPRDCTDFSDEVSFLRGQYHYKRNELEDSLLFLARVSRDNVLYLKSTFLRGVVYSRLGQIKDSISTFADILRYTVDSYNGVTSAAEAAFRSQDTSRRDNISTARLIDAVAQGNYKRDLKYYSQLAVLNMARLLYEQNKNPNAVRYYDYIPINGFFWLEALFESSWALFRMGEKYHDKALGNLQTLSSPFFRDEYTPEAPILKAVILYARCDYGKSLNAVNEFNEIYAPLLTELDGYVQDFASSPEDLYIFLRRIQADPNVSPRVSQILNALFANRELKRINAHITEMERELKMIKQTKSSWSASDLAAFIEQVIELTKDRAANKAGELSQERLRLVVEELRDLKGKADAIDIEISVSESTETEMNLKGVDLDRKRRMQAKRRSPDREHIYWPFDGEYWRDELGYYLYSIQSKCGR